MKAAEMSVVGGRGAASTVSPGISCTSVLVGHFNYPPALSRSLPPDLMAHISVGERRGTN